MSSQDRLIYLIIQEIRKVQLRVFYRDKYEEFFYGIQEVGPPSQDAVNGRDPRIS